MVFAWATAALAAAVIYCLFRRTPGKGWVSIAAVILATIFFTDTAMDQKGPIIKEPARAAPGWITYTETVTGFEGHRDYTGVVTAEGHEVEWLSLLPLPTVGDQIEFSCGHDLNTYKCVDSDVFVERHGDPGSFWWVLLAILELALAWMILWRLCKRDEERTAIGSSRT